MYNPMKTIGTQERITGMDLDELTELHVTFTGTYVFLLLTQNNNFGYKKLVVLSRL